MSLEPPGSGISTYTKDMGIYGRYSHIQMFFIYGRYVIKNMHIYEICAYTNDMGIYGRYAHMWKICAYVEDMHIYKDLHMHIVKDAQNFYLCSTLVYVHIEKIYTYTEVNFDQFLSLFLSWRWITRPSNAATLYIRLFLYIKINCRVFS